MKRANCNANWLMFMLVATCFIACRKHEATTLAAGTQLSVAFVHTLPGALRESSGLCFTDGRLWTFGDSGNPNAIYSIDTTTGDILQTVIITNFTNVDWEDIDADETYIYVGDIGNNNGARRDLKILRIRKSDIANAAAAQILVTADAINFSYTDQTDFTEDKFTNFNGEALVCIGNFLYVFSKDAGDAQTRCYQLPNAPGTYAVAPISFFNSEGEITSAAYNAATNQLALGGYASGKLQPFIWFFKDFTGTDFFSASKLKVPLSTANTPWQTEGLTFVSPGQMFLSCESTSQNPAALYAVSLHLSY